MLTRPWLCTTLLPVPSLLALDRPKFRGPDHNGISRETEWPPSTDPQILWRASVGLGFSSTVVAEGKGIATGHDGKKAGTDTVRCFDAVTGTASGSRD